MQYDDHVVLRPHVSCLVSGAKRGGQDDGDDDEEHSQTEGDPKLLLQTKSHLARKLRPEIGKFGFFLN